MKEYDRAGLTTAKTKRANSIIPASQVAINNETSNHLAGIQDDMATMKDELQSVMSMVHTQQQSIPAFVPAQPSNSNTSAITLDRTHREMMEQRNKIEQQDRTIAELKQQLATQHSQAGTAPTYTSRSTVTRAPDMRVKQKDNTGQQWYQIAHYCSRHGYNYHHDNDRCKDKHIPIRKENQKPWQPGATHTDHKNGSNLNQDKYMHWFNPSTKQYSPTPPL